MRGQTAPVDPTINRVRYDTGAIRDFVQGDPAFNGHQRHWPRNLGHDKTLLPGRAGVAQAAAGAQPTANSIMY
jgi:hypothetical protein